MESWKRLLRQNQTWSKGKSDALPEYFRELAREQNPDFLWIGCSDSRVPAEEITGTSPGELFVHRNIANLVVHTDLNLLSVLQYAVDHLLVDHVIVCGHYGCGGVRSAMKRKSFGLMNHWLRHIKDTYKDHRSEIDALDELAAGRRMVELNVNQQVANLAKTEIVQRAWQRHKRPMLHGWVYDMTDGRIIPMNRIGHDSVQDEAFRFNEGL